jgi:thiol:disulfide interchange protein
MNLNTKRVTAALVCIVALGAFTNPSLQAQTDGKTPPSAQALLNGAIKMAKAENKAILIHFGASWCGWCKRLEAFLHDPQAGKLMADHYVVVALTVQESPNQKALENPGADELMSAMGGVNSGLPFYFFLDKEGKKIADSKALPNGGNIGHPANAEEIKAFEGLLERTAPRMTSAQRAQIVGYLTKNIPR